MILIINAVNLSDGIDGLAASLGIVASLTFGVWFYLAGKTEYAIMAATLTGTLVAFLRFNLSSGKTKIFMGDTGSLIVGFLIAAMTIRFNEINAATTAWFRLVSAPAISIAIVIVPLYDTLRVFTIRIINGHHPFTADNRHIHHLMLRAGYSHKRSTLTIAIVHILIIALAFSFDHMGILRLALILLITCILLTGVIYLLVYRRCLKSHGSLCIEDIGPIMIILHIHKSLRPKRTRRVPIMRASPRITKLAS
jgi:UDP-N-acetylmuramyl pentapeptide phosphotransferase/UDP-N-acetylglucosamine-1-phosphate transferase